MSRALIDHWCANPEFPASPVAADIDYGAEADDQPPMIADDGEVSIISAHLARFATDTLRPAEDSDYPFSAYMIGMRKEWIFNQPFQTFPIDLTASLANAPGRAVNGGPFYANGASPARAMPVPPPHLKKR